MATLYAHSPYQESILWVLNQYCFPGITCGVSFRLVIYLFYRDFPVSNCVTEKNWKAISKPQNKMFLAEHLTGKERMIGCILGFVSLRAHHGQIVDLFDCQFLLLLITGIDSLNVAAFSFSHIQNYITVFWFLCLSDSSYISNIELWDVSSSHKSLSLLKIKHLKFGLNEKSFKLFISHTASKPGFTFWTTFMQVWHNFNSC